MDKQIGVDSLTSRITICPFYGNVQATRPWLNVLCPCGAKFYIHNREWWDRKTGKVIKEKQNA